MPSKPSSSSQSLDEKIRELIDESWRTVGEIHRLLGAGEALDVARAFDRLWEAQCIKKGAINTISGRGGGGGELRLLKLRRKQDTKNAPSPAGAIARSIIDHLSDGTRTSPLVRVGDWHRVFKMLRQQNAIKSKDVMNKLPEFATNARRVLFVTSEIFPLAKTGGLADVSSALPLALSCLGADVRVMLPAYPQALDLARHLHVVHGSDVPEGRLLAGRMPESDMHIILFDAPPLFAREGGIYQDEGRQDWPDNDRRFAAFSRAAALVALGRTGLGWCPEVVHANDWHAGLVSAFLHFSGESRPKSIFTIHNLAFQGNFPLTAFSTLGLPTEALSAEGMEFYSQISYIKAAIRYSDRLTTVSPTYAREILTPEHGCGFDGLLRARAADLVGILNGLDYGVWDPANDVELPRRYSADDLTGKDDCKAKLRHEMGLSQNTRSPIIAYVNRLTDQKMADVVLKPYRNSSGPARRS